MIKAGDIIAYLEMCSEEGVSLQRGMNFKLHGKLSVILMSLRRNAPYADRIEENGRILIYEGHDVPSIKNGPIPKQANQELTNPNGSLTQNGLFYNAAMRYKHGEQKPELVKVYEKIHSGIWVYNGLFGLIDAGQEESNARRVFKFRLEMVDDVERINTNIKKETIEHNRLIPASVKLAVWKRDKGRCVICGNKENLHFDHIIPYSMGGSSLVSENIQLLCAKHNLAKRDKLE